MVTNLNELSGEKSEAVLAAISLQESYLASPQDDEAILLKLKHIKHTELIKGLCHTALIFASFLTPDENVTRYIKQLGIILNSQEPPMTEIEETALNLLLASQKENLTDFHLTLHTIEDTVGVILGLCGLNKSFLNRPMFEPVRATVLTDLKQSVLELEIEKLTE